MQILTCPVGPEVVLGKLELLGDSGRHHNKSLVCYVGVIWLSCVKIWYKNSNFLYIGRTAPKSVKDNVVHTVCGAWDMRYRTISKYWDIVVYPFVSMSVCVYEGQES